MTLFEQHMRDAMYWVMDSVNKGTKGTAAQRSLIYGIACADQAHSCAYTRDEKFVAKSVRKMARKLLEVPDF